MKSTLLGVIFGTLCVLVAFIMEGGKIPALINIPAFILVIGGTAGVLICSFSLAETLGVVKLFMVAIKDPPEIRPMLIDQLVGLSNTARREGNLALESTAQEMEATDPFFAKALQLVADSTEAPLAKDLLETDLEQMEARHRRNHDIFKQAGGFAPTLGIIGTVLGLVHVLEQLSEPEKLGPLIAGAFLATFFGVASANLFWLPVMNALKKRTQIEVEEREMIIEGALSILAGDNPRVLNEKLQSFLPPSLRTGDDRPAAAQTG